MNWDKYPYFYEDEFTCKCGCGLNGMDIRHMDMLYVARIDADTPFVITSGIRCQKHNLNEGGSQTSDHLTGQGTDIKCTSSTQRHKIVNALLKAGFKRIGIGKTFIHAGSNNKNPNPVIWLY